ncbi:RHS repeat-associated core domain-containing protein [Pontibacter sp. G13]|uniref:RHS repeat domain-containing protein n=1 Tax=Pontibacter sp. G13 TaxID=3074898 RepID=UPI00288A337A|nr:RHS repeat-associated core domain-containing protein [Pontibacter sp. G13]WNJ21554.1 RHS repeat-associated core domain-containing protein [Pontibacter sp. G13]
MQYVDGYTAEIYGYSDYFPFGMLMPGRNGQRDGYRYGFNGQEKDDEIKGSGNSVNFKFRMYDPRIGRFFAVDPLAPDYPWYTPYQFAGNTPIMAMDLEGLEPASVVTKTSNNRYQFTEPAIKLLSWASGVDEQSIRDVRVKKRAPIPFGIPWYPSNAGGGGLTTKKIIRLTPNFFDNTGKYKFKDRKGRYGPKGAEYNQSVGDDVMSWLSLNSHEVGHIPQAQEYKTTMGYFISFIVEYAKAGSHDGAGREQEADEGRKKFNDFVDFTNKEYGQDAIKNLFEGDQTDEEKNSTLDTWFKSYEENKQGGNEGGEDE